MFLCKFYIFVTSCVFVICINENKSLLVKKIPDGMKLGISTSSYQIEGAWNVSDKSPSIWDTVAHLPNTTKYGTAGDACKSYEYYKRDIEMIKFLGVDSYRFSISWPRVLPTGSSNKISGDGVRYYNNLINELIANNIEPVVTMYHWDLPQSLQDLGGWANPLIADWFEDYSRVLFETFGDRVKIWNTINEPMQIARLGYGSKILAPRLNSHGTGEYLVAKHLLLANARAWHLYDKQFRPQQKGTVGIAISTDMAVGLTDSPDDAQASSDVLDFNVGLYAHPIFTTPGDYPESVKRRVDKRSEEQGYRRSRLPKLTQEEIEFIKGTSDYYGFIHYSTNFYTREGVAPGSYSVPSHDDDLGVRTSAEKCKPTALIRCSEFPRIRQALNWVKQNYNNPPIMIFENGFGTFGGLQDKDRVSYLTRYLDSVIDAVEKDGVNVTLYTVWSLMDSFEWDNEYRVRFGVFETDFESSRKTRRPRLSAFWLQDLTRNRTLNLDYEPHFENLDF